jgi:hypothetical protein
VCEEFALDLPNDISRVEFAPSRSRVSRVEQLGEQDLADFAPPRPRRKRSRATGVQIQPSVSRRHQSRTAHSAPKRLRVQTNPLWLGAPIRSAWRF